MGLLLPGKELHGTRTPVSEPTFCSRILESGCTTVSMCWHSVSGSCRKGFLSRPSSFRPWPPSLTFGFRGGGPPGRLDRALPAPVLEAARVDLSGGDRSNVGFRTHCGGVPKWS